MSPLTQLQSISKRGEGDFFLKDITFSQRKLEKIAIAGETGAGKSTLLKIIAGLVQPDDGELVFEGRRLKGPDDQLVPGYAGIAYLSQHFELQKSLRVEQVLDYANKLSDRAAGKLYAVCQIDHLLHRRTDQLSGGEKQRVAICRLLSSSPRLLLLDEPFSHLDPVHKLILKEVIRDIGEKLKISCILVSHDPHDTLSWADRILVLKNGECIQMDTPETVYYRPVNAYAGGLFGSYNLIVRDQFRLFNRIPAVKALLKEKTTDALFVRPEHLKVVRKSKEAVPGTVERIAFFGSFLEVHIRLSQGSVVLRTAAANFHEGDDVYLGVARKGLWPLDQA